MSDLQCPATVVLIPLESLTSDACARALEGRRLSALFLEPASGADPDVLAALSDLADATHCELEFADPTDDRESFRRVLNALADGFRGETIAFVATAATLGSVFGTEEPPPAPVVLDIDSDGWSVVPQ